jgi:hypothetical protein
MPASFIHLRSLILPNTRIVHLTVSFHSPRFQSNQHTLLAEYHSRIVEEREDFLEWFHLRRYRLISFRHHRRLLNRYTSILHAIANAVVGPCLYHLSFW